MNFEKDIPEVEVPVYFLIGREDYTTNQDMAYDYYQQLDTPEKKFFWFEGSGHNNCFEDPDRFIEIIRNEILVKKLVFLWINLANDSANFVSLLGSFFL